MLIQLWLMLISALAFLLCVFDKIQSRQHRWRVNEKMFWLVSLGGGSLSLFIAMILFNHKTNHKRFMIGLPLLMLGQYLLLILLKVKI